MYDAFENALQILILVISITIALSLAFKTHEKVWILLSMFYGCWVLGDLYWQLCLMLFGDIPQLSLVSNLSWYASFIFLYILLRHVEPPRLDAPRRFMPFIGPIFSFGMAVFFIVQSGGEQIVSNLISALLMGFLLYAAIVRLKEHRREGRKGYIYILILALIFFEYGMWISTSFAIEDNLMHPYYWCDTLLSISFLLYIPVLRREGEHS